MIDLSIVVCVYNEAPSNLLLMLERLSTAIQPLFMSYEVIFVNDGSNPSTSQALRQIAAETDYVKLVVLSRNFGQQAAITAGIDHAEGKAVVNLDSDLQDPPEVIPDMVRLWKQGYEVVYAQRSSRRDRFGKRLSAYLFYRVLGAVSSINIPWDTGDFRLMDYKVVHTLRELPEKTRFLRGLIPWVGFRQIGIQIDRSAREAGETSYTIRKLLSLAMDGLLSFSVAPLYMVLMLGAVVFSLGLLCLGVGLIVPGLRHDFSNSTLLYMLMALTGLQTLSTGIVAVYLAKTLDETRARPTYIVAERLGHPFGTGLGTTYGSMTQQTIAQKTVFSTSTPMMLDRS